MSRALTSGPMEAGALFARAGVDFSTYERLTGLIHDGAFDLKAWEVFLQLLQAQLRANYVSLVLLPDLAGPGLPILFAGEARPALLTAYTDVLHGLDPFVDLPRDCMLGVEALISEADWLDSVVYRNCLAPLGIRHLAGADLDVGGEAVCRFRICRSADRNLSEFLCLRHNVRPERNSYAKEETETPAAPRR